MGIWTQPVARIAALMEGTYPSPTVAGRAVPVGTFQSTALHGELDAADFPGAAFDHGYSILPDAAGYVAGLSAVNARAGMARKRLAFTIRVGYLFGQDAAQALSAGVTAEQAARLAAVNDGHLIEEALVWEGNWGGVVPGMYSIRRTADTTCRVVLDLERLVGETPFELEVAYTPGTVFP